ncbi:VOC family protein [Falsibacillus albus]|uniref:VOC family protein n=1 Tax=Falsibacillus albus TaxID=2478915 RepID=A0A3L7JTS9_9BACI|nr:VOC family protein [Falsibacillus albus]RLQ94253.1 VOC family protein [Falsibacillus albus]
MLNNVCVITVKVDDLKKAMDFYTNVLDFEISKRYGEKIVSLVHHSVPIVLEETVNNHRNGTPSVLLGILSNNIEEDFNRLKSLGAKVLFAEPQPCPPGRFFMIEDPAGNHIEIVEFSNE